MFKRIHCKDSAITRDLAQRVSEKTNYPRNKLKGIMHATFEAVAELLGERGCVNISQLGSFRLTKSQRKVYDFQNKSVYTREVYRFAIYPAPKFKARTFKYLNTNKIVEK